MCGIAGVFDSRGLERKDSEILDNMCRTLAHRGPDEQSVWKDEESGIGLCHTRLAVIDLSDTGRQPMVSEDGRYIVSLNGEIYNYQRLRVDLKRRGYTFRGSSDTEVLLAIIHQLGIADAVPHLRGMFAFAVRDRQRSELHLVRDRMGEKPLYYGWTNNRFVWGSELKAFHCLPDFPNQIARETLVSYMRHGYVPTPKTIYEDIFKLRPGSILTISHSDRPDGYFAEPGDGVEDKFRSYSYNYYWEPAGKNSNEESSQLGSATEYVDDLERLLRGVVRQEMIADVPLGAFLSGGIDSSLIVAMMCREGEGKVNSFTVGFDDQRFNEAEHAQRVAKHLGTRHTEMYVRPDDVMELIPGMPEVYDEPFADSSQLPTYLVSRMTRQHVTVSLSGDGGDELFGGYNRYFWGESIWRRVGWWPYWLRAVAARSMSGGTDRFWEVIQNRFAFLLSAELRDGVLSDRLNKLALVVESRDFKQMYRSLVSTVQKPQEAILDPVIMENYGNREQWCEGLNNIEWMMRMDLCNYLPDDILVKNDRAAMASSLETRMPFLDHELVEYALSMPTGFKIHNGQGKWVLRQILYKYLPAELVDRPKSGFAVPLQSWLRGPLKEWAYELLNPRRIDKEGIWNSEDVSKKWNEHLSGKRNWQYYLWNVLMFQAWSERWKAGIR